MLENKYYVLMNRKILPGIAVMTLLSNAAIFGQVEHKCGTFISIDQKMLEDTISVTDQFPRESLPQLNRTLSIAVFVVNNTKGSPVNLSDLNNTVNELNSYFAPIALNFKICTTTYIENYQFDRLVMSDNEKDILIQHSSPNIINLYLVSSLYDENINAVTGYTYMPGDKEKHAIFLDKDNILGTTLAHQMGHFLNLYHTHEREAFGTELVNRSNCSTAGDRVCDTQADPGVHLYMSADNIYTGTVKDANKELYSPSPKNIMSFGPDNIRCIFTRGQLLRVVHSLGNYRKNLR